MSKRFYMQPAVTSVTLLKQKVFIIGYDPSEGVLYYSTNPWFDGISTAVWVMPKGSNPFREGQCVTLRRDAETNKLVEIIPS